jgi:FkbM family methyltransferase
MSKRKIREWALPYVKKYRTYIDIGACQGDTTNPFIDEFEKVVAFEPNPLVFSKISDKAEKYNVGLGSTNSIETIVMPNGIEHPEHGSIVRYNEDRFKGAPRILVNIKRLDDYNFTDVDLIKIDVEHYEMDVCLGAKETILKYKPVVIFENKRNEADHVLEWFEKIGYKTIKHKSDTVAYYDK